MSAYQARYERSHALVIGIDDYQYLPPLGTAVRGAEDLAELLEDRFNFDVTLLPNADATRANIIDNWFDTTLMSAGPDDRLLVYFAGHGQTFGARIKHGYLALPNSEPNRPGSMLRMRTVLDYAEMMSSKHLLFILDACFGGLALPVYKGGFEDEAAATLVQEAAVQVMTAGDEDERVPDGYGPGNLYSLFTWLVMEGLEGKATSRGVLTARSLYDYVRVNTAQTVGTALTPMLRATLASKGDFVFSELRRMPKPAAPPAPPPAAPAPDLSRHVQALYAIALNCLYTDQLERARDALLDVLDLDPNHARVQEKLAEIEERRTLDRRRYIEGAFSDFIEHDADVAAPAEVAAPPPPEPVIEVVEPEPEPVIEEIEEVWSEPEPPPPEDKGLKPLVAEFTLPPPFEWCDIPGVRGWFMVTDEGEMGPYDIAPFRMAKYPITYAQFQAFIDASDGFYNDEWWKGLAKRETGPGEQRWPIDHHPRENVSWYDAVAFCRWLSHKLGYEVRLPTEWEWQRAAQGNDGREYPWGSDFDPNRCNIRGSGIMQTTPVDKYSTGKSPYGVYDMAGNVWEWCLNEYDNPGNTGLGGDARRAWRGGSWNRNRSRARAIYRNDRDPYDRLAYDGFRLVVSVPG